MYLHPLLASVKWFNMYRSLAQCFEPKFGTENQFYFHFCAVSNLQNKRYLLVYQIYTINYIHKMHDMDQNFTFKSIQRERLRNIMAKFGISSKKNISQRSDCFEIKPMGEKKIYNSWWLLIGRWPKLIIRLFIGRWITGSVGSIQIIWTTTTKQLQKWVMQNITETRLQEKTKVMRWALMRACNQLTLEVNKPTL